jgi:hypothetical protein
MAECAASLLPVAVTYGAGAQENPTDYRQRGRETRKQKPFKEHLQEQRPYSPTQTHTHTHTHTHRFFVFTLCETWLAN